MATDLGRNLSIRLAIGLAGLAVLAVLSFGVASRVVGAHEVDAPTIDVSGRQRMLSQRVSLLALRYVASEDPAARRRLGGELDAAIDQMAQAHRALVAEHAGSGPLREIFHGATRLDLRVADYVARARSIRRLPADDLHLEHPVLERLLAESEVDLLVDLDRVVGTYEAQAVARVAGMHRLQLVLLFSTLAIIAAGALGLFGPLVEQLGLRDRRLTEREAALRVAYDTLEAPPEAPSASADRAIVDILADERTWWGRSLQTPLTHLAGAAKRRAARLGKEVDVVVRAEGATEPGEGWPTSIVTPLWLAMAEIVGNAVDHGIEEPDERGDKDARGLIQLDGVVLEGELHVTVSDDGAGIDWIRLVADAEAEGRCVDRQNLEDALFAAGTGRGSGHGMAAARRAIEAVGGRLEVHSRPAQGTVVHCLVALTATPADSPTPLGPQPPPEALWEVG